MTKHSPNPFEDWPVIFKYTREQALEDGVLIDVSETAKEAGIKFHTVITARVMGEVVATPAKAAQWGESDSGRLWDVLTMLRHGIKNLRPGEDPDHVNFSVIATDCRGRKVTHKLWSLCGPSDRMEPVITIMMRGED
jgi:hypothetical protein